MYVSDVSDVDEVVAVATTTKSYKTMNRWR